MPPNMIQYWVFKVMVRLLVEAYLIYEMGKSFDVYWDEDIAAAIVDI